MSTALRIFSSILVALFVATLGGVAMMSIPGTPHRRAMEQALILASYSDIPNIEADPRLEAANTAFDEWLRIGRQADWVDSTVLPVIAGLVIIMAWRRALPFSIAEITGIAAGYAAGLMWRDGSLTLLVGVLFLVATLGLSYVPLLANRVRGNAE